MLPTPHPCPVCLHGNHCRTWRTDRQAEGEPGEGGMKALCGTMSTALLQLKDLGTKPAPARPCFCLSQLGGHENRAGGDSRESWLSGVGVPVVPLLLASDSNRKAQSPRAAL